MSNDENTPKPKPKETETHQPETSLVLNIRKGKKKTK